MASADQALEKPQTPESPAAAPQPAAPQGKSIKFEVTKKGTSEYLKLPDGTVLKVTQLIESVKKTDTVDAHGQAKYSVGIKTLVSSFTQEDIEALSGLKG